MEIRKRARTILSGPRYLLLAALAVVLLGVAQPVGAQIDVDPTSCGHFETYEGAQAAFDNGSVSDPRNLDADGDGIVCEDAFDVGDGELTEDRFTCDDFASQGEAQAFFDGDATERQRFILDPDQNGQACEGAGGGESPPVDETTCGAFETQADAQEALETDPDLQSILDANDNGVACEDAFPDVVVDPTSCGHFESQEAAQDALEDPTTPNSENLDGDGDGIACEDAFDASEVDEGAEERDESSGAVTALPKTGSGPTTSGASWLPLLASVAVAAMKIAALIQRQRIGR